MLAASLLSFTLLNHPIADLSRASGDDGVRRSRAGEPHARSC